MVVVLGIGVYRGLLSVRVTSMLCQPGWVRAGIFQLQIINFIVVMLKNPGQFFLKSTRMMFKAVKGRHQALLRPAFMIPNEQRITSFSYLFLSGELITCSSMRRSCARPNCCMVVRGITILSRICMLSCSTG